MKFTIYFSMDSKREGIITINIPMDSKREDIIERCTDAIADVLERNGYDYYSIEYDPREIEVDK